MLVKCLGSDTFRLQFATLSQDGILDVGQPRCGFCLRGFEIIVMFLLDREVRPCLRNIRPVHNFDERLVEKFTP